METLHTVMFYSLFAIYASIFLHMQVLSAIPQELLKSDMLQYSFPSNISILNFCPLNPFVVLFHQSLDNNNLS